MKRVVFIIGIAALLVTGFGCGGKKPLDPTAMKTENILSVLRDMGRAYEKKDLDALMKHVADDYQSRDAFETSIKKVFDKFETIRFNIQYTRMLIMIQEKGRIRATFNWDAEWVSPKGTTQKGGGRVTFVHDQGSFKLIAIDGKNPFIPTEGSSIKK